MCPFIFIGIDEQQQVCVSKGRRYGDEQSRYEMLFGAKAHFLQPSTLRQRALAPIPTSQRQELKRQRKIVRNGAQNY